MTTSESVLMGKAPVRAGASTDPSKYFYAIASTTLLVLMFLGFQQFYLHGRAFPNRPLSPPIMNLIILHGVTMTLWMILSLVQPLLIVNRKHRIHMKLGMFGTVLAIIVVVSGFKLGIDAARIAPPEARIWGMTFKQFMAIPLITIILFAGFVTTGVVNRKRKNIHRPMMFLASLAAVGAAIDRTVPITSLYNETSLGMIFGPFTPPIILGLLFLGLKSGLTRSFDPYFAAGCAILALAGAGTMQLAVSPAWDHLANFLYRF